MPRIARHRLRRIGLTRGDIGSSRQPGKAQDRHQAVKCEPSDVRVPNPGEIGGGNARQFRSLVDRQALAV
jgi:hypothetical protein